LKIGDLIENFTPVDPYQLMVENFGARLLGEPSWILPMNETIHVMQVLDEIAATKGGPVTR
jgi:hypothetical protein